MRSLRLALAALSAAALGLLLLGPAASGDQILQYGFEARGPVWKPGSTDAAVKVLAHELTGETAHGGLKSEHVRLQVERGTFIHYVYDLPQARITDDLTVSLWLKSNRPNVQLLCRIVFPRESDPEDPSRKLTALVRCEPYQSTRWKLIDLRQPVKRLREQQQLLNAKLGKQIDAGGAYVDQLVLNVFDGTGVIDAWIDDLEVGPVQGTKPANPTPEPLAKTTPGGGGPTAAAPAARRASDVKLDGKLLKVGGQRFFMRGIRYSGTPLRTLRDVGLNTVWLDESAPAKTIEEAANLGFWIVPTVRSLTPGPGARAEGQLASTEAFTRLTSRFLEQDAVLGWYLGDDLTSDQYPRALRLAETFRSADPERPVIADVWSGRRGFANSVPRLMLGTHRWPLFTSMELDAYRAWLDGRRRQTSSPYNWTWVQTHLPDWYDRVVYDGDEQKSAAEGAGPQPEQIRLLAYCSLAAGYRGLAFWSDRYLADNRQGRDRLLALALLNQELRLLEPILTQATSVETEWITTSRPDVGAAVIRAPQGTLVLPIWVGRGSQFVPGQAAAAEVVMTVPVAVTSTAWEVTPGRIQSYPIKRVQGGCEVRLRNFSLTSALLFTSDLGPRGLVVALQDKQRAMGRLAAQWLCDQAKEELTKVERTFEKIDAQGHALSDGRELLKKAHEALQKAQNHRRDGEHVEAYGQAEVALRALRLLMRTHWDRAVRDLDSPVASAYATSFFTLPRHWELLEQLKQLRAGATVLPHGDFELPPEELQAGWVVQEAATLDALETRVRRVARPLDPPKLPVKGFNQVRGHSETVESPAPPRGGKQCLLIDVRLKDPDRLLDRAFVAVHSPAVRLRPGSLVRVSAWVKTDGVSGSPDGALFYDSVGGEPLAVRITREPRWKKYSLYRKVPASGQVSVTLATSGLGKVYFDDVRIEPLE